MRPEFRLMHSHGSYVGSAATRGRFVVSWLGFGESLIARRSTSLKLVLEGEEEYLIDGARHVLKPGLMLIVPPGAPIRATVRRGPPSIGICLDLPPDPASELIEGVLEQSTRASPIARQIEAIGVQLAREPDRSGEFVQRIVSAAAHHVPFLVADAQDIAAKMPAFKASTKRRLLLRAERARAYLDQHPDRAITLTELASAAAISPYLLARSFKAAFGMAPATYHRQARLEWGRELISEGLANVTEAAARTGYSDLSAFTKAYGRVFGKPPSQDSVSCRDAIFTNGDN